MKDSAFIIEQYCASDRCLWRRFRTLQILIREKSKARLEIETEVFLGAAICFKTIIKANYTGRGKKEIADAFASSCRIVISLAVAPAMEVVLYPFKNGNVSLV